jgi:hypothetical protein
MVKKAFYIAMAGLLVVGSALADAVTTLNFTDLNAVLSNNTLVVDGSTSNLVVTGVATNNNFLYSVTYTGADFDGDSTNDTVTVDVLVEGLSGTIVTNGGLGASSAMMGSTAGNVIIGGGKWYVGDTRMNSGETLRFTVVGATSSVGTVAFDGFGSVTANENTSYGHEAVIGEGTGLNGYSFIDNLTMAVSPAANPLYVTSATANSIKAQWGVGHVDFGLTVDFEIERTVVDWDGTVDSNWNMPGNWTSGMVPGRDPNDLVILSGSNDAPVVATVVEATKSCSIQIVDDASLEVCDSTLLCDDVVLGNTAGLGGGHFLHDSGMVKVSGDLRVGDAAGATTESLLRVAGGASLTVDGEVYVGNGTFEIARDGATIKPNNLTVDSGATLRFDFDQSPVSTVQVANQLIIADGAKLEIDLRTYNTGGNELELVTFSTVSGSFDPANITITGLGGGVVSMDGDSLNLTVIDDVTERSSSLWFVATAGTGENDTDLQINTGRRIRNLSSPDMSYSTASDGDDRVHSVSWSGSDFDGDGTNDTVSFDLRVEGFSDSTYHYENTGTIILDDDTVVPDEDAVEVETGTASMTGLGSSDVVSGNSNGWGVGTDYDLDAGQTLRFTVENLQISTAGGYLEGFVGVQLNEGSGYGHILIIGEGLDLQWEESNYPVRMAFNAEDPLFVTSAADSGVKANQVAIKLMVSELPDFLDTEASDYSHYPMGPQHRSDYPAVTHFNNWGWSWDTLPMRHGVGSEDPIPDEIAEVIATTYDMISLGGRNTYGQGSVEAGTSYAGALLKKYNPNVVTVTYKNAGLHHDRTAANATFDEDEWTLYGLDADGNRVYSKIRGWFRYNHNHPECRKWWSDWCVGRLADPNIDGIVIDKCEGGASALLNKEGEIEAVNNRVKSYQSIWERMPEGSLLSGNLLRTSRWGGSRELLHMFNGSYSEGWAAGNDDSLIGMTTAEGRAHSVQMFREAQLKGMYVGPNFSSLNHFSLSVAEAQDLIDAGHTDEVIDEIREVIQTPLAYYLITVEPNSYFGFSITDLGEIGPYEVIWNPKPYIEEYRQPLGEPLGPPERNGYIFTRSFEHVDVWLNVENDEAKLTWDWMPIADAQSVECDEDSSVAITLTGSDPRGTDFSYIVFSQPTHGTLTTNGTLPYLTYTPDPDFFGEDSFAFKTENDMAKSLKATVAIAVPNSNEDAPVADGLNVLINKDSPSAITLTGNDADGDALTYCVVSQPTNGLVSGTAPDLIYTPFNIGFDSFLFEVDDGSLTSSVATVSIEVTPFVYLDRFDNDGLDVNTNGVGGGAGRTVLDAGADWQDNGDATFSSGTSYLDAALLYSTNAFQSAGGFELTVYYTCNSVTTAGRNLFGFGLLESATNHTASGNPFGALTNVYSLGVNIINEAGINVGLNVADGVSKTALDTAVMGAGTARPVVLRVEADGDGGADWRYSVAGVHRNSGHLETFDFSKRFNFAAYGQDDERTKIIHAVMLDAILAPPVNLISTGAGNDINLTWDYDSGSDESEDGFYIYQSTNGEDGDYSLIHTNVADTTTYTVSNLIEGPHWFKVTAFNIAEESPAATTSTGYSNWIADFGLSGDDALFGADMENGGVGDGYDNLTEYALGMNPTNADAGTRERVDVSFLNGTNWFEYVHYRRTDYLDQGLNYLLIDSTNLVDAVSFTNTQDQLSVGDPEGDYEAVTNSYEINESSKFIKLKVRQN